MQFPQVRFVLRNVANDGAISIERRLDKRARGMEHRCAAFVDDALMPCGPTWKLGGDFLRCRSKRGSELGIDRTQFARVGRCPLQNNSGQGMFDPLIDLASLCGHRRNPSLLADLNVVSRVANEMADALKSLKPCP
jgi:hypothetical protein